MNNPRSCILHVGASAGRLCGLLVMEDATAYPTTSNTALNEDLIEAIADLLKDLYWTSTSLRLHLVNAIYSKLELNRRKYPVELCKGKAGKYTQYSHVTGVTMENQSTVDEAASSESSSSSVSLSWSEFLTNVPALVTTIQEFANERQWTKFHTPRNLVLALLGEVGELAELVQWKGDMDDVDKVDVDHHNKVHSDNEPGMTTTKLPSLLSVSERDKLSQEIADVSIYLLRLVSVTSVTEALMDHLLLRHHQ